MASTTGLAAAMFNRTPVGVSRGEQSDRGTASPQSAAKQPGCQPLGWAEEEASSPEPQIGGRFGGPISPAVAYQQEDDADHRSACAPV
jgi:hypothetical protein